jgi:glycerophosphoryl diester phosphodiesterase
MNSSTRRQLLITASLAALISCAPKQKAIMSSYRPWIIAHRGASGLLPEHTLEAYQLGAEQGADVIEPDLVMTKDGVLIARHDHYLGASTDVSIKFPERQRTGSGVTTPNWFSEDFSALEFATLRARQPMPQREAKHNDRFEVPTFAQILDLRAELELKLARPLYVYPELKLPSTFAALGLDPVPAFVAAYRARSSAEQARIWIQCFEPAALRRLRSALGPAARLTQLLPANDGKQATTITLAEISDYAQAIGPNKIDVIDASGRSTGLLEAAQALGLQVHPWTFRDDVLPSHYSSTSDELRAFFDLGVDGVFTDFPGTAMAVREASK